MKKIIIALLSVILCLLFSGCGGDKAVSEGEIAGGDWRTTGIVRDSGSIARDGKVTDVLICVHEEDAVFYYDKKEQTVFTDVKYPMAVKDPWEAYKSTDFAVHIGKIGAFVSLPPGLLPP